MFFVLFFKLKTLFKNNTCEIKLIFNQILIVCILSIQTHTHTHTHIYIYPKNIFIPFYNWNFGKVPYTYHANLNFKNRSFETDDGEEIEGDKKII